MGKTWSWMEGTCAEKVIANLYKRRTGEELKKKKIILVSWELKYYLSNNLLI